MIVDTDEVKEMCWESYMKARPIPFTCAGRLGNNNKCCELFPASWLGNS